jgi:hypothetical protein
MLFHFTVDIKEMVYYLQGVYIQIVFYIWCHQHPASLWGETGEDFLVSLSRDRREEVLSFHKEPMSMTVVVTQ